MIGMVVLAATTMMNVAHRGLWKETNLPQNTVEAIKAAYDAGAKVVETDFIETESGEMICLHDVKSLEALSSIVIDPRKITPQDRERINLGEKMGLPQPYRLPLLKDVLAVVPKNAVLQAEIKGYGKNYAQWFDEAVKAAGLAENNIIVSCFQYSSLKDFHTKYPKYKTLWLGCELKKGYNLGTLIAKAKAAGFDVFCPGCDQARKLGFTRADADRVRAAGLDFCLYGVNTLASFKFAAELGATSFTCNYFKEAYEWAKEVPGVELLPKKDAPKPIDKNQPDNKLTAGDLSGCYSTKVKTIAIVMPASIPSRKDYERCKAAALAAGYKVKEAPRMNFKKVAPVEDRVADFEEMWMDPEVDLVVCARGGTGAQDLLAKLDWEKLRTRKQRVLGFSNITYLLNAMLKEKAGHPFSGPSFTQFRYIVPESVSWLGKAIGEEELPPLQLKVLKAGSCSGLPCGGHISMLKGAVGMKMLPDATGRIVFLECSSREPETHRAELDFLAKSGWLNGAAGIVFGDITPAGPARRKLVGKERWEGYAREAEIKREFAGKMKCPVFDNYPYGHIARNFAIDFLREVEVSETGMLRYK